MVLLSLLGCSSVFYQPRSEQFVNPKDLGFDYENVEFSSAVDAGRIHGWMFKGGPNLVVQFHGNAENISTHFYSWAWVVRHGFRFLAFDYRGYGQSVYDKIPSQLSTVRDGVGAIRFAAHQVRENESLILVGQSLGGAILMRALGELKLLPEFETEIAPKLKLVVIESSFFSYQEIATDVLARMWPTWLFQWLGRAWVSDEWSPEPAIETISPTPLMVIHGDQDRVIPLRFGKAIFAQAGEPKTFLEVKNGGHIDSMLIERHGVLYRKKFLKEAKKWGVKGVTGDES